MFAWASTFQFLLVHIKFDMVVRCGGVLAETLYKIIINILGCFVKPLIQRLCEAPSLSASRSPTFGALWNLLAWNGGVEVQYQNKKKLGSA